MVKVRTKSIVVAPRKVTPTRATAARKREAALLRKTESRIDMIVKKLLSRTTTILKIDPKKVKEVSRGILDTIKPLLPLIKSPTLIKLKGVLEKLLKFASKAMKELLKGGSPTLNTYLLKIGELMQKLRKELKPVFDLLKPLIEKLKVEIKSLIGEIAACKMGAEMPRKALTNRLRGALMAS